MRNQYYSAIFLIGFCLIMASYAWATAVPSADKYAPNPKAPSAQYEGWDVSRINPRQTPYKVVFFGDSILSGYGLANPENKIFNIIVSTLDRDYYVDRGVLLKDMSHDGETSASAVKRIKYVIELKPDIVVLSIGMNDALYGTDPDILYNNLEIVLLELSRAGIYVMLTGMQATTKHGYDYLSKFNTVYAKLAHKYPVVFLPNLMQGVSGNRLYLQHDGFYPNQDGAKIIANSLMLRLTDMFKHYKRYNDRIEEIKIRQKYMNRMNRIRAAEGRVPMFSQQEIDALSKQSMPAAQ